MRSERTELDPPPVVSSPLFFLDYDGTLAPIVDKPMEAVPHPDVPSLLEALEEEYPLLIITGRHLRDLSILMPEASYRAIGLHGTQEGTIGGDLSSLLSEEAEAALARLRRALPTYEGIEVEEKGPTFAVHYRAADDAEAVREQLEKWTADLPESLEAIWGKMVVELRPQGSSKGVAVERIAEEFPGRTPVYLGDDVTDEDAFRALGNRAITVKVGGGDTAARYRLRGVEEVITYLKRYLEV